MVCFMNCLFLEPLFSIIISKTKMILGNPMWIPDFYWVGVKYFWHWLCLRLLHSTYYWKPFALALLPSCYTPLVKKNVICHWKSSGSSKVCCSSGEVEEVHTNLHLFFPFAICHPWSYPNYSQLANCKVPLQQSIALSTWLRHPTFVITSHHPRLACDLLLIDRKEMLLQK